MKYLVALESDSKKAVISQAAEYDLVVIDAQDYSADEIKTLKKAGAKVLSYINVGAIEKERSYFQEAKAAGLLISEYEGWDGEWWVKAQETKWKAITMRVATKIREKGIDGFWADNLDVYYMAKDKWKWNAGKLKVLYENLISILESLHGGGFYVMANGGDVFVHKLLQDGEKHKCIDAVNQETVISSIKSYKGSGTFGEQDYDDSAYYKRYIAVAARKGKAVYLLEYTRDLKIRSKIEKFCAENGYSSYVSTTLRLGEDLTVKKCEKREEETVGGKCTVYDLLEVANHFDGLKTVNEEVAEILKKHGHSSGKTAGCTNTVMAMLYELNAIECIGGYANNNKPLMQQAKEKGLWHSGKSGILPGDIVIFGRGGESNHTELAIGDDLDISGNYNGGCYRRKRSSHSSDVLGFIRPAYKAMSAMDDLQIAIAASDVLIGVYGVNDTRKRMLSVYGAENAAKIQSAVTNAVSNGMEDKIIAVACIADHYGKDPERSKKIGKRWADKTQKRINAIYGMRGKTVEQAAKLVINDQFGKGKIRELLLTFCGYTPHVVQNKVKQILEEAPETKPTTETKYRIHVEHFFRKEPNSYGACTAVYQYAVDGKTVEKCVLIDTARYSTAGTVIEDLKAQGVKQIDALIISHAHGDHYGGLGKIAKAIPIKWLYLPDTTELDKHQKGYGNKLRRQANEVANHRWYKPGDSFITGGIRFDCLYQCKAKDLKDHDDHLFVNDQSPVCTITCGNFVWHTAGDLRNPGNNLFVAYMKKAGKNIKCTGAEFHWHTDANANNDTLFQAIRPKICVSNYNREKWHSGRDKSKKRAEAVGAHCYAVADDGHVFIDVEGKKATVTTSKSGKHDVYTI